MDCGRVGGGPLRRPQLRELLSGGRRLHRLQPRDHLQGGGGARLVEPILEVDAECWRGVVAVQELVVHEVDVDACDPAVGRDRHAVLDRLAERLLKQPRRAHFSRTL